MIESQTPPDALFVVEDHTDVAWLRANLSDSAVILALTPQAQAQLKGARIPHVNTLEFFGQDGHRSVLESSEAMVGVLSNAFQCISRPTVNAAFVNLLALGVRVRLRYWIATLHIVDRACKHYGARVLVLSTGAGNPLAQSLGVVISAYAAANGLNYRQGCRASKKFFGLRPYRSAWSEGVLFELAFWWARWRLGGRRPIIAAGPAYGMPDLISRMRQELVSSPALYLMTNPKFVRSNISRILRGEVLVFRNTRTFLCKEERRLIELQSHAMIKTVHVIFESQQRNLTFSGVFLGDCIERFLLNDLVRETKQLYAEAKGIERIIDGLNPILSLSQHALGQHGALGEICEARGSPSLLVTHGSHVPQDDPCARKEWSSHARTILNAKFGYIAVQTPWAEKFIHQEEPSAKILRSGPLLFGVPRSRELDRARLRRECYGIKADLSNNPFVVLHAGTPKPWSSFRPWVYETTDEYLRNINDLILAAEQVTNVHVAIRFRPSPGLSLEAFKSLIKSSPIAAVYTEGGLETYLYGADLLVSYSSTAIEEALQNRVPVLLYDPEGKYHHLPGRRLQPSRPAEPDSVYHVDDREELSWALKKLNVWYERSVSREDLDWSRHQMPTRSISECLVEIGIPESDLKIND